MRDLWQRFSKAIIAFLMVIAAAFAGYGGGSAYSTRIAGESHMGKIVTTGIVDTGTLAVTGTSTLTGVTTVTGNIVASSGLTITGQLATLTASLTITNGQPITPTASVMIVTPNNGNVVAAINRVGIAAGTRLTLINPVASTLTISDGTNQLLAGDIVLGIGDTASLIFDGTQWIEISRSNN
jgi:hypothetical protein